MRRGFNLVELMIVVAILGVLAAVAIPSYVKNQLRAKRAEAGTNVHGIGDAQVIYNLATTVYATGGNNPASSPSKKPRAFERSMAGWKDLGWYPDGLLRCTYSTGTIGPTTYGKADATCDLDGNGEVAMIRYFVPVQDKGGSLEDIYPDRF